MTTRFALDSGIVIRILRRDQRAARLVSHLSGNARIETSAIVVLEVLRGCCNPQEELNATALFRAPDIVDVDYAIANVAGRLIREWKGIFSSEEAVPDAIVAASAIATSATLVTLNTRQFGQLRIPGLELLLIDLQAADWIRETT